MLKVLGALLAVFVLSGCDIGLGASVLVVNDSSEPLTLDGSRLAPDGGTWGRGIRGCSDRDLTLLDEAGNVFAEIDDDWCGGETWTITGRGEVAMTEKK